MLRPHLKTWIDRHTKVSYIVLASVAALGAWLVGMFDSMFEVFSGTAASALKDVTLVDLGLSFIGLVLFCSAGLGIVLLIVRNRKPMSKEEGTVWEQVRGNGKWSYVRAFTFRGSKTVILLTIILLLISYWRGTLDDNIKLYLFMVGGILLCLIYAAINSWIVNESEYQSLQSPHDNALQSRRDRA